MWDVYIAMTIMGLMTGLGLRVMEDKDGRYYIMFFWTVLFGGYCVLAHIWSGLLCLVLLPILIVLL